MNSIVYIFCALGCLISLYNFYLSVIRTRWIQWRQHIPRHKQQHVSGVPLFGSMLAVLGAFSLPEGSVFFVPVMLIALLDVGGLHVFAGVMIYDKIRHR